ncbi:hypothetical protein J7L68_07795 [bacterium]|nr:hypothetical protein [bacterium]
MADNLFARAGATGNSTLVEVPDFIGIQKKVARREHLKGENRRTPAP